MAGKGINYAIKFSGMLAGLTTFICCASIFVRTRGDMNMGTLFYTLTTVIPAALIVGTLGFYIGKIFDGTKKKKKLNRFIK